MDKYLFIVGYIAISFVISAVVLRSVKRFVPYVLISATVLPVVLVGIDAIYRGYVESWTYPAFTLAWLVSLMCAVVVYLGDRIYGRKKQKSSRSAVQR